MWKLIIERLPSSFEWFCAFLAFIIPYVVYKLNQKFHQQGDAPWKKSEEARTKQE